MLCTVRELRKLGFKVKARHERIFNLKGLNTPNIFATNGEVRYDENDFVGGILRDYQSKINSAINLYLESKNSPDRLKIVKNLFSVAPRDGMTFVSVYFEDELLGSGEAYVNSKPNPDGSFDSFCRTKGLKIALTEALQNAHLDKKLNLETLREKVLALRTKEAAVPQVESQETK